MKTITISIVINLKKGTNDESQEKPIKATYQIDWCKVRKVGSAAKVYTLARLRNLLNKYDTYIKEKEKQDMAEFPPHSLFCEKRCCQKSQRTYMNFLKKELVWSKEGHLL